MPRPKPIPRRLLIVLLLCVSLIPPIGVVTFVALHRPPPEAQLEAEVELGIMPYQRADDEAASIRLLQCVTIRNPNQYPYNNISVSLNKQFYYHHPKPLLPQQSMQIPLEFFITKGGNIAFQTGSKKVDRVTIFAQIPSGERAVAERYFANDGSPLPAPSKSNSDRPKKLPSEIK